MLLKGGGEGEKGELNASSTTIVSFALVDFIIKKRQQQQHASSTYQRVMFAVCLAISICNCSI
jgi:hypothetical protein